MHTDGDKKVGIIGYGYVGKAVAQLGSLYNTIVYDPAYERFNDLFHRENAYSADFIFLCVPTPLNRYGDLDTSIVISCLKEWYKGGNRNATIIIKSTMPLNSVDALNRHYETSNIVYSPEFLSQATHLTDFKFAKELFVGGDDEKCKQVIDLLVEYYKTRDKRGKIALKTYNTSCNEAELLKLTRNSFYAAKVSFFNEIYQVCEKLNINYNTFQNMFSLDGYHPWIGDNHMKVPGPDGKLGFGGACLPKDAKNLVNNAKMLGVDLNVLRAAVETNFKVRGEE